MQPDDPLDPREVDSELLSQLLDVDQALDVGFGVQAILSLPLGAHQPPPLVKAERLGMHLHQLGSHADDVEWPVFR
ncbi:hypothetical protein D3C86_1932290 [compost metagenome]